MATLRPHKVGERPLKVFFEGLHIDYRNFFLRKIREILTISSFSLKTEPPTLEECFTILGKAEACLMLIKDCEDAINKYSSVYYYSVREINELKESTKEQTNIIRQMIRAHLQQLTKETKNERD